MTAFAFAYGIFFLAGRSYVSHELRTDHPGALQRPVRALAPEQTLPFFSLLLTLHQDKEKILLSTLASSSMYLQTYLVVLCHFSFLAAGIKVCAGTFTSHVCCFLWPKLFPLDEPNQDLYCFPCKHSKSSSISSWD